MLRFLKANMGIIQTPIDAAIRRSHRELFERRARRTIGMNWQRSFERSISRNIIWHNGGTGGYHGFHRFAYSKQLSTKP